VAQIVRRYQVSVHYWEILSEPNLRYTWNIDSKHDSDPQAYAASVRRYVTLLQDGYLTVKATDPTATVLFRRAVRGQGRAVHARAADDRRWRFFDIMDFHAYGQTPTTCSRATGPSAAACAANPPGRQADLGRVRLQLLVERQGRLLRDEGQKARNFVKATKLVTRGGRAGPVFWFTLHGNNPDSPGYGLITRDSEDLSRRRLKAFYALRAMPAARAPRGRRLALSPAARSGPVSGRSRCSRPPSRRRAARAAGASWPVSTRRALQPGQDGGGAGVSCARATACQRWFARDGTGCRPRGTARRSGLVGLAGEVHRLRAATIEVPVSTFIRTMAPGSSDDHAAPAHARRPSRVPGNGSFRCRDSGRHRGQA
jgi:hypothetical protein